MYDKTKELKRISIGLLKILQSVNRLDRSLVICVAESKGNFTFQIDSMGSFHSTVYDMTTFNINVVVMELQWNGRRLAHKIAESSTDQHRLWSDRFETLNIQKQVLSSPITFIPHTYTEPLIVNSLLGNICETVKGQIFMLQQFLLDLHVCVENTFPKFTPTATKTRSTKYTDTSVAINLMHLHNYVLCIEFVVHCSRKEIIEFEGTYNSFINVRKIINK